MKASQLFSAYLFAAVPLLAQCDPAYDEAPPVAPSNPPPASAPMQPGPAPAGDDGQYSSNEYSLGTDSDTDSYQDDDPSALTDFHSALDPYGTWVDDPNYGTVWVPSSSAVGPDFAPYSTEGHWAYDDDWVWVSDYPWGWAPFHYGRWVWAEGRGWVWIPGRAYRGAWVSWGVDDGYGYVGWYPMGPGFLWWHGAAVAYPYYAPPRWVYCRRGDVFATGVGSRVVTGSAAAPIAGRVHPYVPATPGVAGPPPSRLGYAQSQVPRASVTATPHLAEAQQFARPSTAVALGAHPPSRAVTVPQPAVAVGTRSSASMPGPVVRPAQALPRNPTAGPNVQRSVGPTSMVVPGTSPAPAPRAMPAQAPRFAPAPHAAPAFHGGGGGHHR